MTNTPRNPADLRIVALTPNPHLIQRAVSVEFPEIVIHPCTNYSNLQPLIAELAPDVLLAAKVRDDANPFPSDVIASSECLRWLHVGGAGVEHIRPWDPDRLVVTNSSGIHGAYMAQYAIAAMVTYTQNLNLYARQQRERLWARVDCDGLHGKTLALVGFGAIGQEIARAAKFFGMRVVAIRRDARPSEFADVIMPPEQLEAAVAQADFCALTIPLTKETRGMFDRKAIAALQPHAVLINLARGRIVDEPALIEALQAKAFRGAFLDVFEKEPLGEDSPLWDLENVIITPHSSSDSVAWEEEVAKVFVANLRRYLAGQSFERIVSPTKGY